MSNIANPGCCCDIGPYYPWLCYETGTLEKGVGVSVAPHTGQVVRTPIVTVSFNAYGSGTVPWYDAEASYVSGAKAYVPADNKVYTATGGPAGADNTAAGPFHSDLVGGALSVWDAGIEIPNQDIDKHCVTPEGMPVDSTADKHYIRFDVWEDSGTPIAEVGNMALRTPGVSYAWHIIEDKRVFPAFTGNDAEADPIAYRAGGLASTYLGSSDAECPGGITCDEILHNGQTKCCTEWVAKGDVPKGAFDKDEWQVVNPNMSKYWLVLADWSEPQAWISGEPGVIIASRNLSSATVADDAIYDTVGMDGIVMSQIREPAEDFMITQSLVQNNLMMLPQVKRAFMSNTMSSPAPLSRGENMGWGNQTTNIKHGWYERPHVNPISQQFETALCNKAKKHDAKGGDAPSKADQYGAEISANLSTISADDKDFYYFEIIPLEGEGGTPYLCGDKETCDGDGALPGGGCCEERGGDYPQEEGAMRRKIVVQHWHRDGATINYSGNLACSVATEGNWVLKIVMISMESAIHGIPTLMQTDGLNVALLDQQILYIVFRDLMKFMEYAKEEKFGMVMIRVEVAVGLCGRPAHFWALSSLVMMVLQKLISMAQDIMKHIQKSMELHRAFLCGVCLSGRDAGVHQIFIQIPM